MPVLISTIEGEASSGSEELKKQGKIINDMMKFD
jgi:hypothetical protein